jgi:hypothetical protein
MLFGTRDEIDCLTDVKLRVEPGEALCLAHKSHTWALVLPAYFHDDGYVLRLKGKDLYCPMPPAADVAALQAQGLLPAPLPAYHVGVFDYAFGYSLWITIGLLAVWSLVEMARQKRRRGRLAVTAPTLGPPRLLTRTDRFVDEQVRPLLVSGEQIQHQAYGTDRELRGAVASATAKAFFAVLTDRRLLFVQTRVGAFSVLRENRGVESRWRSDIVGVDDDGDGKLVFRFADGGARPFHVARTRGLSNQTAFLDDVPRLLAPLAASPGTTAGPANEIQVSVVGSR